MRTSLRGLLLKWPKRPRLKEHADFGCVRVWIAGDGAYSITQYPESTGRFICCLGLDVLGNRRTLKSAQRYCERHERSLLARTKGRAR